VLTAGRPMDPAMDPVSHPAPLSRAACKVAVVCACYNRAAYLAETIDSLLQQDFDSFEVIVVNDGSSDPRVREILDGYGDDRLRVIHQDNAGFVQAIRRAIAASQAPFIAIQGAGDVSHPQRLARQYAFLAANPEVAIAGCRYHNVTKRAGSDDVKRLGKCRNPEPTAAEIRRGNPFAHGEVMIRRACYDAVGGYRPFFVNSQDKDLWLRLSMRYRLCIIEEVLYERRIFAADGIAASLKKTLGQIAFSRVADRCHDERLRGLEDSVDRYGVLALSQLPRGAMTTFRVARAVRQVVGFDAVAFDELKDVRYLYGRWNYVVAAAVYLGLTALRWRRRPKNEAVK
jgi:hypothetical protein